MKDGLLCIQYWPGDRDRALRLARFIADIEPKKNKRVDLLLLARFDTTQDPDTIKHVSRKFDVRTYTTKSRVTGHPDGCWHLWFSGVEWFYHMRAAGQIPAYKWLFQFEADCAPIRPDWISQVCAEWDRLGAYVVGSETLHWRHHINGNLMLSADQDFQQWLVKDVTAAGVKPGCAWDIDLFPAFARWGIGATPAIWNCCGKANLSQAEFDAALLRGVSFIHGVKNDDNYRLSRAALTPGKL